MPKKGLGEDPGVWAYVFMSSSANQAAELSLGRADEASAPTRAGLACRAACKGRIGSSNAGKMPALLWESVAYGKQTEVTRIAQVLSRTAEVSY